MEENLVKILKEKVKPILENNIRFHCYAHAMEVLENVRILLEIEKEESVDKLPLFAAALLHDLSNSQEKEVENKEGAELADKLLSEIDEFPKEKIKDVKRLILSLDGSDNPLADEVIINSADEMAGFSDLGFIRSFMIAGKDQMKVKDAIEWEMQFLTKRFSKFKMESARNLVKKKYRQRIRSLQAILNQYNS